MPESGSARSTERRAASRQSASSVVSASAVAKRSAQLRPEEVGPVRRRAAAGLGREPFRGRAFDGLDHLAQRDLRRPAARADSRRPARACPRRAPHGAGAGRSARGSAPGCPGAAPITRTWIGAPRSLYARSKRPQIAYWAWRETRIDAAIMQDTGRRRQRIRVGCGLLPPCRVRGGPPRLLAPRDRPSGPRPELAELAGEECSVSISLPSDDASAGVAHGVAALLGALRTHAGLREAFRHHEVLPARAAQLAPTAGRVCGARAGTGPARHPVALPAPGTRARAPRRRRATWCSPRRPRAARRSSTTCRCSRAIAAREPGHALYAVPAEGARAGPAQRLEADVARARPAHRRASVEIYDGDTPDQRSARRSARRRRRVLFTTPDMLHFGHPARRTRPGSSSSRRCAGSSWTSSTPIAACFGAHVAQVLRRLLRIARHHGARPRSSAPRRRSRIPAELARAASPAAACDVIEADGSPRPRAARGAVEPVAARRTPPRRSCSARRVARRPAHDRLHEVAPRDRADAHLGGRGRAAAARSRLVVPRRLPARGAARDRGASSSRATLLGVISTSALEMGIDVGGLDVCILVGYPGSQIATWQRAGRVGRAREGVIDPGRAAGRARPVPRDAPAHALRARVRARGRRSARTSRSPPPTCPAPPPRSRCARDEPWLAERRRARQRRRRSRSAGDCCAARPAASGSPRAAARTATSTCARPAQLRDRAATSARRSRVIGTIGVGRVIAECHEGASTCTAAGSTW